VASPVEPKLTHLLKVARASRPLPGPDGGLAFASNSEGYHKTMFLDEPQGVPRTLADSGDRTLPHAWTEFGLVVRHDSGGSEIWQLSMVGPDHVMRALTTDAKAIHQSVKLHPDRRRVGLGWNAGGGRDVSLGELDLETGELTPWATPGDFWYWEDWSPDGTKAAVNKVFGTWTEAHILKRDGSMVRVLPDARRVSEIRWTAHGMFMLTDAGGRDFMGLAEVDPERPEVVRRWLIHEDHDVEGFVVDHTGQRAAVVVNRGVYDEMRIVDLANGAATDRVGLEKGVVLFDLSGPQSYHMSWSQDGSSVFASWEHPTHPAEIYEWPAGRRWTQINEDKDYGQLAEPIETSYRSFDGLEIPSLYYQRDAKPRPAVVFFHGGPEGQSRGNFIPIIHLLTGIGVNVFLPNVRGSTGYGFHFQSLDDKTLRWDAVKDGCEAARFLKQAGTATKTAAMGGSYGGFMTLAVLVEDPGLWDAGVDTVGIANWHTFFKNMPPWRGVMRKREYGDPDGAESEFLRQISPIHAADTITAPLLIIHGRNDPRVPLEESEQIAEKAPNAEIIVFDDEGHGVAKLANQVIANSRILAFLQERLLGTSPAARLNA
jgi:dipeptidyl aminopeptidase/acylaminoacyl peptidase